jgi:hydrogenase maturation protein HypF
MLEEAAEDPGDTGQLPYRLSPVDGVMVFDPRPTLAALLAGMTDGQPVGRLASRFQRTIAAAVVDLVDDAVRRTRVDVVCLSGGVFQNDFLAETVPGMLTGVTVLRNRRVPCNDGGISYGQAAVAAARLRGAATCA